MSAGMVTDLLVAVFVIGFGAGVMLGYMLAKREARHDP